MMLATSLNQPASAGLQIQCPHQQRPNGLAAHPSYHLIRGHQRPPLKTSAADSEPLNDPSHLGGLRAGSGCGHRGGDGLPDRRALGEARLGDQAEVPWRV